MWYKIALENSSDESLQRLQKFSSVPVSVIESNGQVEVFGDFNDLPEDFAEHAEEISSEIDWDKQWVDHSPGYHDGLSSITLSNGETVTLKPGGGFGDYSHPTTKLMLEMMSSKLQGKTVLDIGCGSGILTLAALKLGATEVWAVDIEPEALRHTEENLKFSNLEAHLKAPEETIPDVVLFNMIRSEQEVALNQYSKFLKAPLWITSGIRIEEEARYLKWIHSKGLSPISVQSQEGWLAFILISL